MRIVDLRQALLTDASFGVSYIVENNMAAVADRLRGLGFRVSNVEDIFEALNELIAANERDKFIQALNVPFQGDGKDAAELAVVLEVSQGMGRASRIVRGGPKAMSSVPAEGDPAFVGPPAPDDAPATDDEGTSTSAVDWINALGNLATGIWGIMNTGQGTDNSTQVRPTDVSAAIADAEAAQAERAARNRRMWLIAGAAVVAIVLLFLAWKKLKK